MTFSNSLQQLRPLSLILLALLAAAVAPLIFPAAQAGHGNLAILATRLLFPAIALLVLISILSPESQPSIARTVFWGAAAGALATIPLEAIRIPGYLLGFMPGNLPRLMGVLLLDRFALGPSTASDIAGWAYHFWNGASFGIIYILLFGAARRWAGVLYGIAVGMGFLISPVVVSLGVGYFGLQFSKGFPITVLTAHLAFGLALGFLANRFLPSHGSPLWAALRSALAFEMRHASQPHS
ncbi:MAG: hypothetical protein ACRD5M_00870 [Candidatus Acidiferrales bacterium]